MAEEQVQPQKGDWVRVWAQVTKASTESGVHPEDLLVRLESHNEHYEGHIPARPGGLQAQPTPRLCAAMRTPLARR